MKPVEFDIYFNENTEENMNYVISVLNSNEKKFKVRGKGPRRRITFKGKLYWMSSLCAIKDLTFWA